MKNAENLYTWIVEFRGGTYISQIYAASVEDSIQGWLKEQAENPGQIRWLGAKSLREVKTGFRQEYSRPVLLHGMQNAWYTAVLSRMGAMHINIVQTAV